MNELKLILMVGISGSGKSTLAEKLATETKFIRVSTDDIRLELTGNAEDQSKNGLVFSIARQRTELNLKNGKSVIVDATNLNTKDRKEFIQIGKLHSATVVAHVVSVGIAVAKFRNSLRERKVPEFVIDKQYNKYTPPSKQEGFDSIEVFIN